MDYKEAWEQLKKQVSRIAKSMDNVENIGVTMSCIEPKSFVHRFLNTMLRLESQDAYAEEEMATANEERK